MDLGDPYDISRDIDVVYTRLPDEVVRWRHRKLFEDREVSVSAFYEPDLPRPITARGEVIIEKRFYGITYFIWDEWFNIIAIYDEALEFKGHYCDIMTPIQKSLVTYSATDLFLDLFVCGAGGKQHFFEYGNLLLEDIHIGQIHAVISLFIVVEPNLSQPSGRTLVEQEGVIDRIVLARNIGILGWKEEIVGHKFNHQGHVDMHSALQLG